MKQNVLVDTGPLVAFLNQRDRYHSWAVSQLADVEPPLRTCEPVLSEACFLLRSHEGGSRAVLQLMRRGLLTTPLRFEDEIDRISRLVTKYADVPMSLADGCLVRMAELNLGKVVMTLDADFRVYRMHGRQVIPTIMPDR